MPGLVAAARAGAGNEAHLRSAIRDWLEEIAKTDKSPQQGLRLFAILTLDLDCDNQLRATFSDVEADSLRIRGRESQGDGAGLDAWMVPSLFPG
jgi:hypothetical protein